jgi:hypothetical protein
VVNRFTFLGLVGALAVFGLALLAFTWADSGADDGSSIEAAATTPPSPPALAEAPPAATPEPGASPLQQAAEAAGCTLRNPPNEGNDHEPRPTTEADYRSNPPTSGVHYPEWAPDGVYDRRNTPALEMSVHALEHGRINVQYAERVPDATVEELEQFVADSDSGYHMLLFENQTDMPFAVAATAWDALIGCETYNAKTIAALAAFRVAYIDQGPELVP